MAKIYNKAKSAVVQARENTAAYYAKNAGKSTAWDKVKDYVNTGRQYQAQAIEELPTYYADRINSRKQNSFLVREEEAPEPDTLAGMSYSGDPKLNAYLQEIKAKADKAVYDPRPAEKPAVFDTVKNYVNTGKQYQVQAIEDTAEYYKQEAKNKPISDDTWFQSGSLSDGWQRGDLGRAFQATRMDLNMNMASGALKIGENAADGTKMLGAWSYGGLQPSKEGSVYPSYGFSLEARDEEKQQTAEFVAQDLIDEDAMAKRLFAKDLARHSDVDIKRDSFLGNKSRALAREAGELAATSALQAVGVPWWLTTGVYAFGNEAENAVRVGADFDEATKSGLISAGAEIFTEAISKGLKYSGWSLSDKAAQKISTYISDDFVNTAIRFGLKSMSGGTNGAITWAMAKFGEWLIDQNDETFREMFTSDEARKEFAAAFLSGLLLKGIPEAVDSVFGKKDLMVQTHDWIRGHYTPYLPSHN